MDFLIAESQKPTHKWKIDWEQRNSINVSLGESVTCLYVGNPSGDLVDRCKENRVLSDQVLRNAALTTEGSFLVVRVTGHEVTVVSDPAGTIPAYYNASLSPFVLGSQPQHVAKSAGKLGVDLVSAVDFILNETVCFPHSWFKEVKLIPPGSVWRFDKKRKQFSSFRYWAPHENKDIYDKNIDIKEWAGELKARVQHVIERESRHAGKVRVLFSGGEDSRAVAGLVPDNIECVLTTVLDEKNREYFLAKCAAKTLGLPLDWIERPQGFYRMQVANRISLLGPGWDFRHTHFWGPIADRLRDADLLIGGYLADTLFKTYFFSNINKKWWRPDKLDQPRTDHIMAARGHFSKKLRALFDEEIIAQVRERRSRHHEYIKEIRPRTAGHWHPLYPLTNQPHYAQYLTSLRIGPTLLEPFLQSSVYKLAAQMPDRCRVDREAFRQAFAPEMGGARWVPTSSDSIPGFGGYAGHMAKGITRIVRKTISPLFLSGIQASGAWSSGHQGWSPVRPEEHFPPNASERMRARLSRILQGNSPDSFLDHEQVHPLMKTRSLSLGFTEQRNIKYQNTVMI